jgi:hypothetical protein
MPEIPNLPMPSINLGGGPPAHAFELPARDMSGLSLGHAGSPLNAALHGTVEHPSRPVEVPHANVHAPQTVHSREAAAGGDQITYGSYVQHHDSSTLSGQPSMDAAYQAAQVQQTDAYNAQVQQQQQQQQTEYYNSVQAQQQQQQTEYYNNVQAQQASYYDNNVQAQQERYYDNSVQASQVGYYDANVQGQPADYSSQPINQDYSSQYQSTVVDSSTNPASTVIIGQTSYQSPPEAYTPSSTTAQISPQTDAYGTANPAAQPQTQDIYTAPSVRPQPITNKVSSVAAGAVAGFASVFAKHPQLGSASRSDGSTSAPQQVIRSSPSGAPPASRSDAPAVTDKSGMQGQITALQRGGGKKWTKADQDKFLKDAWESKDGD